MPLLQQDSLITYIVFILPLFGLALYAAYEQYFFESRVGSESEGGIEREMATRPSNQNLNVLKKPLGLFSRQPLTGYYRDGYCRTGPDDTGNHAIAATLTTAFLDFSASRGNNLRAVPGLDAGCKWCLCTARWKEALDAFESGEVKDRDVVPKVALHATDESALSKGVDLGTLKKWAADGEAQGGGGALEKKEPLDPKAPGGVVRETH